MLRSYARYLDKNGFKVKIIPTPNLEQVTLAAGIPQPLIGCHLTKLAGHVFEGHIPAPLIKKFLAEPSSAKGLAIPGMPAGLPGMPLMAGMKAEPIAVYLVGTPKPNGRQIGRKTGAVAWDRPDILRFLAHTIKSNSSL